MIAQPHAAVFGKLPTHGDFIARGLSETARLAWDEFASAGLERARAELGEGFEAAHQAAPPWRFVLGPGAFGPGWRAGAMAPSVDRADRLFVIAVFAEELDPESAGAVGERIADEMERVIYLAFQQGLDADGVAAEAGRAMAAVLAQSDASGPAPSARWWTDAGAGEGAPIVHRDTGSSVISEALGTVQARSAA